MIVEDRVITWKMAPSRYLHQVEVEGGYYFHLVTDSSFFSTSSLTLRNKILAKRSKKETRGLKRVRGEREEWLNEDSWSILCFGGSDNLELRKKIYGKVLRMIKIQITAYPRSSVIYEIKKKEDDKNMIIGRYVWLGRNLRKRIKDPLPYISNKYVRIKEEEKPRLFEFIVTEISFIRFNQKIKEWGW